MNGIVCVPCSKELKKRMRIIKKGELLEEERTCEHCGTIFAYIDSDIRHVRNDYAKMSNICDVELIVKCPLCKKDINII